MAKGFDEKCLALALHFVDDDYEAYDLAQEIQDAIEDFLTARDNANEAAWERQQEALMESGGPDNSHYRASLIAAGRGHLLKD